MRIWVSRPELVTFRHYKNRYIKPQEKHYLMPLPTSPDIFVIRGLLFAEGLALSANLTEYAFHIRSLIDLYTLHYKSTFKSEKTKAIRTFSIWRYSHVLYRDIAQTRGTTLLLKNMFTLLSTYKEIYAAMAK